MSNLKLWESLEKTDPKYTKNFQRSGGFKGTAQNPTYAMRKMTDIFGPCGIGWGINKPEFQIHPAGELGVLVYSTVCLWYVLDGTRGETWGVGGDMIVAATKNGLRPDDEAFKKATTDAITNAMKSIGMAADLHLGMFDDSKYVNSLNVEFGNVKEETPKEPKKELTPQQVFLKKAKDQLAAIKTPQELIEWSRTNGPHFVALSEKQKEWIDNEIAAARIRTAQAEL